MTPKRAASPLNFPEKVSQLKKIRSNLATKFGEAITKIHGHHIVQKTIPKKYFEKVIDGKLIKDHLSPGANWRASDKAAWYIGKSHDLLEEAGISVFGNLADLETQIAANLAAGIKGGAAIPPNLCFAINGRGSIGGKLQTYGTHAWQSNQAVYERLLQFKGDGARMSEELRRIGRRFEQGLQII
ncbi:MAG: hypothetical protein WCL32_21565 [Planctomycetota bacterium]